MPLGVHLPLTRESRACPRLGSQRWRPRTRQEKSEETRGRVSVSCSFAFSQRQGRAGSRRSTTRDRRSNAEISAAVPSTYLQVFARYYRIVCSAVGYRTAIPAV